ncbi:MAG: LytTR family transcriptional regulator [Chitinophagaceae bacterium]|nr:LytTR family transcriptional regulator [Chitinophagaceae bacterium]
MQNKTAMYNETLVTGNTDQTSAAGKYDFVFVKSEYKIIKIKLDDIIFCEGMKDYTQIYICGRAQPVLTLQNLKNFSSRLPESMFVRVHRSFVISLQHIETISRNEISIGKKIVPIGNSYRNDFFSIIERYS